MLSRARCRPEDANTKRTRACVEACRIGLLLQECRFLRTESLHELLKALSLAASRGTCTHDVLPSSADTEAASVFAFEFLFKVVLNNRYAAFVCTVYSTSKLHHCT